MWAEHAKLQHPKDTERIAVAFARQVHGAWIRDAFIGGFVRQARPGPLAGKDLSLSPESDPRNRRQQVARVGLARLA